MVRLSGFLRGRVRVWMKFGACVVWSYRLGRGYASLRAVAWAWGWCNKVHEIGVIIIIIGVCVRVIMHVGFIIYLVQHVP